MQRWMIGVTAAAMLSGCAGMSRITSYGTDWADAKVTVDGANFSVWTHPTDNDLLVQRSLGAAMGQGFIAGATFGAVNPMEPKPFWVRAAQQITDPLGCKITDAYTLDNKTSWETPYECPSGVDLRALVKAQRDELRKGKPIHR